MADDLSLASLDPLFHGSLTHVSAADFADDAVIDPALASPTPPAAADAAALGGAGGSNEQSPVPASPGVAGRADRPDGVGVLAALEGENARLRALVAALESRGAGQADGLYVGGAGATEAGAAGTLDYEIDGLTQHFDWPPRAVAEPDRSAEPDADSDPSLVASTSGAAAGLVFRLVLAAPKVAGDDPLALTRRALSGDLAAVQAQLDSKLPHADPAALPAGIPGSEHAAELASEHSKAGVLRDIVVRLEDDVARLRGEVDALRTELAELVAADSPGQRAQHEAGVRRVVGEVKSFVESLIRQYRGKGTLPAIPPVAPLAPLPSTMPKKRGRPSRLAPRASAIPPQLAHLVPDVDSVRAREADTPIRRKGVKRSRDELERERVREEEGDMLRSLVGIGGWRDDEGA